MAACGANQLSHSTPAVVSAITSVPTDTPTQAPTLSPTPRNTLTTTAIVCPPSPLGQELPLPQDVEGFVDRYYQVPARIVEGMEFHFSVPIGLETEKDTVLFISNPQMGDRHMLWLEKLVCNVEETESSPQGHSYYQVVDVVELPRWEENYAVDLNTCLVNSALAIGIVGLGEIPDDSSTPSKPLYAWKVNIENMEIVPIETQTVKCYFHFSRLKP